MNKTIKYTSENGYTGVLYGESSMVIYDANGKESMHTGSRGINTYDELVELVEDYPRYRESLKKVCKRWVEKNESLHDKKNG